MRGGTHLNQLTFQADFDYRTTPPKGIVPFAGDHILRRGPMKKLLSAMMMAMFLVSVTGVAFADEMKGDHKDMKAEKKAEKKEKKK